MQVKRDGPLAGREPSISVLAMDPTADVTAFSSMPEAGRWCGAQLVHGTETPVGVLTPRNSDGRWFVEAAVIKVPRSNPVDGSRGSAHGSIASPTDHGSLLVPTTILIPALFPLQFPGELAAGYDRWRKRPNGYEPDIGIDDVFAKADRRNKAEWLVTLDRSADRTAAGRLPATVLDDAPAQRRALAGQPWALIEPSHGAQALLDGSPHRWSSAEVRSGAVRNRLQERPRGAGRPPVLVPVGGYIPQAQHEIAAFLALRRLQSDGTRRRRGDILRSPSVFASLLADCELRDPDLSARAELLRETAKQWVAHTRKTGAVPTRIDHQDHARQWLTEMPPLLHVGRVMLAAWLASEAFTLVMHALCPPKEMVFCASPFLGEPVVLDNGRVPFAWAEVELRDRTSDTFLRLARRGLDVDRVDARLASARTRLRVAGFDGRGRRALGDALLDAGLEGDVIAWHHV